MGDQSCFLSYSRTELFYVLDLVRDLQKCNLDIWIDFDRLMPGEDWNRQIRYAVSSCADFLVIMSKGSLASEHVQLECRQALDEGKRIFVIMFEPVHLPPEFAAAIVLDGRGDFEQLVRKIVCSLQSDHPTRDSVCETWWYRLPRLRFKFITLIRLWFWPLIVSSSVLAFAIYVLLFTIPALSDPHIALSLIGVLLLSSWTLLYYLQPPLFVMLRRAPLPRVAEWQMWTTPLLLALGFQSLIDPILTDQPQFWSLTVQWLPHPVESTFPTCEGVFALLLLVGFLIRPAFIAFAPFDLSFQRFLVPGAQTDDFQEYDEPTAAYTLPLNRTIQASATQSNRSLTFSLHYTPFDEIVAQSVQRMLTASGLTPASPAEATQYHIGLVSNLTPLEQFEVWMRTYPMMIWVVCSSIQMPVGEVEFHCRQWVDYRRRRESTIRELGTTLIAGRLSQPMQFGLHDLSRAVQPDSIRKFCPALLMVALAYIVCSVLIGTFERSLLAVPFLLVGCVLAWIAVKTSNRTLSWKSLRTFQRVPGIVSAIMVAALFVIGAEPSGKSVPVADIVLGTVTLCAVMYAVYVVNSLPYWFLADDDDAWLPIRTRWFARRGKTLRVRWPKRILQSDRRHLLLVACLMCACLLNLV